MLIDTGNWTVDNANYSVTISFLRLGLIFGESNEHIFILKIKWFSANLRF